MAKTSNRTLIILAAMLWYGGVVALGLKSSNQLLQAARLGADFIWLNLAIVSGLILGAIKAKYLFSRLCQRNISRIRGLENPRPWQFFRGRFFVFLGMMIFMGKFLAWLAQGKKVGLMLLGGLEISIASALLFSSYCFWQKRG